MNQPIPPYSPPARPIALNDRLPTRLERLEQHLDRVNKHQFDTLANIVALVNTGTQGFGSNVASGSTISITAFITRVTGTTTINTINAPPNFSGLIVILAPSGFSLGTSGNIANAATLAAGTAKLLCYSPVDDKWFVV